MTRVREIGNTDAREGEAAKVDPSSAVQLVRDVHTALAKVLVGQRPVVDRILIGLLTGGHVLLEGVPGLAKTLIARSLATAIGGNFHRVQFTPDLLPADLLGTEVYSPRTGDFSVRKGPIFTQLLLADEINRSPAKVQSALLEAMQERQVTIGPETFPLPELFLVLATQNPIEHEGTYALPEAQVDRFMMKVCVGYPSRHEEEQIIDQMSRTDLDLNIEPVTSPEALLQMRRLVDAVHLDAQVRGYVLDVVACTRGTGTGRLGPVPLIQLGASPRAGVALVMAAKATALLAGRDYVTPHDVKTIGHDVLRHRILLTFEAEAEGLSADAVLDRVFGEVAVP